MIGATVAGTVAVLVALVDQGPITALLMLGGVIAGAADRGPRAPAVPDGPLRLGAPARRDRRDRLRRARRRHRRRAGRRPARRGRQRRRPAPRRATPRSGRTTRTRRSRTTSRPGPTTPPERRRPARDDPGQDRPMTHRLADRPRGPVTPRRHRGGPRGARAASPSTRRWRSRAGSPRSPAARSASSARTSSAPAPSRSAAPTCGSPGSRAEERAARRRRRLGRQPRPGRRARRRSCSASSATVFMPEGAPIPKEKATRGYGADVRLPRPLPRRGAGRGPAVRRRDRGGADPPLRPRRHRRRPGHLRARDPRAGARRRAPWWCRPAAAACWPASRSRSRRMRPDVRVVGVQAEGAAAYPRLARRRRARSRWSR